MNSIMNGERYRINNIYISATNPINAKHKVEELAKKGECGYICVSNMRMVKYAAKDKAYRDLMLGATMCLPDGMPLVWLGKLWGLKNIACTNGPSLFKEMLSNSSVFCKYYLLGETEDVIQNILQLNKDIYHSPIVGAEALPFCEVKEFDYENIAKRIKDSGANIVWTAMRAPKQDQFNQILCRNVDVIAIGVGRAFRLLTGEIKQAPKWAQKCGIGGIFIRRTNLFKAIQWYITSSFIFLKYVLQIMYLRFKDERS